MTKEELSTKAFSMFREWTKNAKNYYPELSFVIIDERILVNDLVSVIKKAVNSLKKNLAEKNEVLPGYPIGFILGFLKAQLNLIWYNEYVQKQSLEYKEFIAFKSVLLFLDKNPDITHKVQELYVALMYEDNNIEELNTAIPKLQLAQEIDWFDYGLTSEKDAAINLYNQVVKYVNKVFKDDQMYFLNNIDAFFSDDEIESIINNDLL